MSDTQICELRRWTAEWDDASFLNDGRDAFKRKDRDFRNFIVALDFIKERTGP